MTSPMAPLLGQSGDLVCRPVRWMDIVKFLVFNYMLHAATVLATPGEGVRRSLQERVFAFSFPMVGTVRAITAIHRLACRQKTPLKVAQRARALCMLRYPVRVLLCQFTRVKLITISGEERRKYTLALCLASRCVYTRSTSVGN